MPVPAGCHRDAAGMKGQIVPCDPTDPKLTASGGAGRNSAVLCGVTGLGMKAEDDSSPLREVACVAALVCVPLTLSLPEPKGVLGHSTE